MARILYGVAGEGSGHSSRAKEIINYLLKRGHEVKIVSYDRGFANLKKMMNFDVEEITGLGFAYRNNRVNYAETALKNFLMSPKLAESFYKTVKIFDKFKPHIIFSDFEPMTATVANLKKIPLISIDNQHRLTDAKTEYPKKYEMEAIAAKTVTKLMVQFAKAYLVITFFKTKSLNSRTFFFPPILREEVLKSKSKDGKYVLVYLTSPFEGLIEELKSINKRFVVYGFNINKKEKNVIFKIADQKGFLKDLCGCECVVANAGFTLISEALYLRKPYLAIPVKGQFEQIYNAYYLEKLGFGKYWDNLSREKIEAFLFNLDIYKKNLKKYKKENNAKIFRKIDKLIKKYV